MKQEITLWRSVVSSMLIAALMFCAPFDAVAQSSNNRSGLLEYGTPVELRVNENFDSADRANSGHISSIVVTDVYSADGTRVLIKAGTPAYIEFSAESNGSWGKAGKLCLTYASTRTVDDKRVSLRLSSCMKGGGKLGGVIVLSVLLFPLGLISGCMKGGMPKIQRGTAFNASVMQDVIVE